MVYAAFLEDPFTWVILATGASLAPLARLREAHVPVPSRSPEASRPARS